MHKPFAFFADRSGADVEKANSNQPRHPNTGQFINVGGGTDPEHGAEANVKAGGMTDAERQAKFEEHMARAKREFDELFPDPAAC